MHDYRVIEYYANVETESHVHNLLSYSQPSQLILRRLYVMSACNVLLSTGCTVSTELRID